MLKKYLPPETVQELAPEAAAEIETAAASENEALPAWLREQTLLDTESGIQYCGSPEDYVATLEIFANAYDENVAAIQKFFDAQDWKNYTIRVHALKSSARIIGAKELSGLAAALEQAGNAEDVAKIKSDTPRLCDLYAQCYDVLAPITKAEETDADASEKKQLTPEELQEVYETFQELATSFDYDSVQFVLEDLQDKEPPPEEKERYEAICQAAKKPDWIELQKLLKP